MDEKEVNESFPKQEQSLDSDDEWKDVETPATEVEPTGSSPPTSGTEVNHVDGPSKLTTDDDTAPDKTGTTRILCFVIGFLVVAAVVITAVLLTYDGNTKSEPAAVIPSTPVAPTSPVAAPVASSPVSSPTVPSPTQLATSSPTVSPTASPTIDLSSKVVEFLATNQVFVNQQDPSANQAVAVLANETSGVLDPTQASKIIQRFAVLTVNFAIGLASPSDIPVTGTTAPVDSNSTATSAPVDGNATMAPTTTDGNATMAPTTTDGNATTGLVDGNSTGGFFQVDSNPDTNNGGNGGSFFDAGGQGAPTAFGGMRRLQTTGDECLWTGVTCANGIVTDLNYYGQQLQGTLPTEIALLADLKHIDLSVNELKGTIPEELYGLTKMEELILHHNQLSGTISDSIGNWWNLTKLIVSHNQLSGTIPATMASGSDIRPYFHINFKNNKLTGTIPSNLRWRQLYYLDLGNNQLTGTLPSDLGETFVRVQSLFLDNNKFQGTLPDSYINAGNGRLEQFTVNNNLLTGAIPSDHSQFNYLNLYRLDGNNFSSMSDNTCKLSVLIGGENVEFKVNCDICNCRDDLFCKDC